MTYTPNITGAVHTKIQHDSAIKHVTGKAHYIDDLPLPEETQETALFLSPHAHAKIISIDKKYFRPTEVDSLRGNSKLAQKDRN